MTNSTFQQLTYQFRQAFDQLDIDHAFPVALTEATRPEFGDYQVNGVMAIAKARRVNPRTLAQQVVAQIEPGTMINKLEVAGPGFINITLNDDYLAHQLTSRSLIPINPKPSTVVIDYSSPNLAKEMHVGHLRSTIIGDALVRLYEFLGHRVIRRNHVGDWGTQFGMLLTQLMDLAPTQQDLSWQLQDLEQFYRAAKQRFDNEPTFADRARECVVKLQANDPALLKIWQQFVTISLNHCQAIYQRLQTKLIPEDAVGESSYNSLLPLIVEKLLNQGVAQDDQGAKCVFFAPDELPTQETAPFIIQKKDGGYLYSTTDLAAVYDRITNLHADILLYVIDARQSLHLQQLFATVRKAKLVHPHTTLQHVAFGTMLGEDHRPFKTRSGGTVKLTTLLDEAVARATTILRSRNPAWTEPQVRQTAEILGIAAVKYADLSKNRICDYLFDFDQMLAFDGNTAPYLLYAYVRIHSIFKRVAESSPANYLDHPIQLTNSFERQLALHLLRFTDRITIAAQENYPHLICNYLYELAALLMKFYEHCPIIQTAQPTLQESRLALAALTAQTLQTGLGLLGIPLVTEM